MALIDLSFWKNKRVFVTGGAGFVGTHLVNALVKLGANVKVFVHKNFPKDRNLVGFIGDLTNHNDLLKRYLESFRPQVIFHLAAQPIVNLALDNHVDTLRVNIEGTYNLLSACYHLRWLENFVYVSTDKVYGNVPEISSTTHPESTTHPYNTSKLSADLLSQMYANTFGTPVVIIRNGNVYGPGDTHWDRLIPRSAKNIISGCSPVIRGDGLALRDYIYVEELIWAYLKAVECQSPVNPMILNLGAVSPYSVADVINQVMKLTGRMDLLPRFEPLGTGEIPNQHFVDTSAKELIGWNPKVDLEEGLRRTLPWYVKYLKGNKNG